jgi:site-specific recombinase XerC
VIEALQKAPTKAEVIQALKYLRREKVKDALGKHVRAAAFDKDQAVAYFLMDGDKAPRTQWVYRMALAKLFAYVKMVGVPLISMGRADANRFRMWLGERPADKRKNTLKANSQRLVLAVVSGFWKYLEMTEVVATNLWLGLPLPKREFKHRPKPDTDSPTVHIMNNAEYAEILGACTSATRIKARTIGERGKKAPNDYFRSFVSSERQDSGWVMP